MLAVAQAERLVLESGRPFAAGPTCCGGRQLHDLELRRTAVLTATGQLAALLLSSSVLAAWSLPAGASLPQAAANGLPLLGRFEALKGASSFIGTWQLGGAESAGPRGVLSLLKCGSRLKVSQLAAAHAATHPFRSPPACPGLALLSSLHTCG